MTVYVDVVMGLNFLVDFLLLLGTNRLAGYPPGVKRSALGAALGGAYAGICLVPGFHFLMNIFWRSVSLGLMSVAAFGWSKGALRRGGLFLLLSMALAGAASGIDAGGIGTVALCGAGVWVLCSLGLGNGVRGREFVPMTINYGDKSISMIALRDTGNLLRDPVTGEQVTVVGPEQAAYLTGLTRTQLLAPLETVTQAPVPGLRLIPYHTVGQPGGMLLGLRFRDVRIGREKGAAVVAFAPDSLGKGEGYQALTGGAL